MAAPRFRLSWGLLLGAILLVALSQRQIDQKFVWKFPALSDLIVTEHYASDIGTLFLGSHRLAADVAYVQFLQYYGEEDAGHHHDKFSFGTGHYPRIKELGTRILRLNPYFNGPILEIAGALAFNLKDIDASLELLKEAIERDPAYHRYRLYVAAILYKNDRKDKALTTILEQAIQFPDCPPLFGLVLGNLLKKQGRIFRAAEVFLHVLKTAPQEFHRVDAARRLNILINDHPEVARIIPQEMDQKR